MAAPRVLNEVSKQKPARPPFERVVALYGPGLLRYCRAQAGAERAEDCFQETMLAALRAYGDVRDVGALRSWLYSIAARKVIDSHRAGVRAPQPVADAAMLAVAPEPVFRDPALWALVGHLPEKQRQAVMLRYCGDLSHREIAAVMATTEAAARRNVFEGLGRLRREVKGVSQA